MKSYFASALLVAAKAVEMNRDLYYTSAYYPEPKYYGQAEPVVVNHVKEPYFAEPHYYAEPIFDFNFSRIFDAAEEVYYGTDSESDIDGDSKTDFEKDSLSESGSSIGLSGPGYTFYSGSDSGTESSSHHS